MPLISVMEEAEALARGQIGYYNPAGFPIHFTSTQAGRSAREIGPMEPVTDRTGKLVPYDPDCEVQVSAKLLRAITPKDANFTKFSKLASRLEKQKSVETHPANQPGMPLPKPLGEAQTLPGGASWVRNGDYTQIDYKGKIFGSLAALHAFMDNEPPAGTISSNG